MYQYGYGTEGFVVNKEFGYLTEPEVVQTNQVLSLGFAYQQLNKFTTRHQIFSASKQLYAGAVALGIAEVLKEYTDDICKLEAQVLSTETSLAYLMQHLQKVNNCAIFCLSTPTERPCTYPYTVVHHSTWLDALVHTNRATEHRGDAIARFLDGTSDEWASITAAGDPTVSSHPSHAWIPLKINEPRCG